MRIVHVAPLEEPVPPQKYGGTELVIHNIVEEQVKRGHEVYLLASGDSQTSANLVPVISRSLRALYAPDEIDKWREFLKIYALRDILLRIEKIQPDIVHNHYAWRLMQFAPFIEAPVIHTMHGPLDSFRERYVYERNPSENYVSISDNQRKAMPYLNWVRTVYNGIDMKQFSVPKSKKPEYFAFLGRTSPEKGLAEIVQMISKTSHTLKIAAKIDTADRSYFEEKVRPFIDGKQIEYIGEIGPPEKAEFLSKAKALLLWLSWEEPFGLVVAEAMAAGTPVIVNKRGSMPELIQSGKTGFLVDSIGEMQTALDKIDTLTAEDCRTHVQKNFSLEKMASDYLDLASELTTQRK
jgi:glycosyltransferase involved in cell wall biosynthesis